MPTRHFREDVIVEVPFDYYQGHRVRIYKKRKKDSTADVRVVINFYVCYRVPPGTIVTIYNFPDPVTLKVGYLPDEANKQLLWYNPQTNKWEPINHNKDQDAHGQYSGYGIATLTTWGDPNVGWG